jgi:hypothetical protein
MIGLSLLCLAVAACASPVVTASPAVSAPTAASTAPTPTSPIVASTPPTTSVAITCGSSGAPPPGSPVGLPASSCPAEAVAIETALVGLDYQVQSIDILPFGFTCGIPFLTGPAACPLEQVGIHSAAYATFVGNHEVAALTFKLVMNGPLVASVVMVRVPPTGWTPPY